MNKIYITPSTEVFEIKTEEMIAASVFGDDPNIPFGGIDETGNLDPESRVPFGNFIFGE